MIIQLINDTSDSRKIITIAASISKQVFHGESVELSYSSMEKFGIQMNINK